MTEPSTMWQFLSCVEDVLQIRGRGCVVVPGIPRSVDMPVQIGSVVRLKRLDGSETETVIRGIELGGSPDASGIPILLGDEISKIQVPLGTEVWLQVSSEHGTTSDDPLA